MKRVHEIDGGICGKSGIQPVDGLAETKAVPSNVGDFQSGARKASNRSRQRAETFHARRLFAGLEKKLIAEADAEIGAVGGDPFAQRFPKSGGPEVAGAVAEGTDAGNHDRIDLREVIGRGEKPDARADGLERLADAAEVAAAVVDDAERRRGW